MPNDRDQEDRNNENNDRKPPTMPQDRDWYDTESNPFVAFRRFADEQVSSMLQSITGLPSTVSSPQSDQWTIFTDDKEYKSMAYRQRSGDAHAGEQSSTSDSGAKSTPTGDGDETGSNNEKPASRSSHPRQPEQDDWRQSQSRRNQHHGASDFFGLDAFFDRFENHLFPFPSTFLHPHSRFFFPDMFEDSSSPAWPITYIMFSPYSPLHLERQAYYRNHRERGVFSSLMSSFRADSERDPAEPQWREAFEDLLRLENGKPMLDREALAAGKDQTGKDWLCGLVNRGSLGDRWKYVSGTDDHPWSGITFEGRSENRPSLPRDDNLQTSERSEEADDELELYERFLQDIRAREREFFQGVSESSLLRFLLDERHHGEDRQYRRERSHAGDHQSNEDTESWLDLVSGGNRKSVPETPVDSTAAVAKPTEETAPRVISTVSRTERRRLADGSVQTKTVNTKRFADGREETDKSVEVTHAQPGDGDSSKDRVSNSGWFWKD